MKCTRIVGRRTLIILMFDDFAPLAFFQQIHGIASWARYFFPCGYILAIPNMQGLGETVSHIFHTHTHTQFSAHKCIRITGCFSGYAVWTHFTNRLLLIVLNGVCMLLQITISSLQIQPLFRWDDEHQKFFLHTHTHRTRVKSTQNTCAITSSLNIAG